MKITLIIKEVGLIKSMFKQFRLLTLILAVLILGISLPHKAFADTYTLSGSVKDSSGNTISGATVTVNDTNNDSAATDTSGNYSLSIPNGTYNITVTPPAGNNFSSTIAINQSITANTILNFIFTPSGTVSISGRVLGPLGDALPNQTVYLRSSGNTITSTTTDNLGKYYLEVSSGTYTLDVNAHTNAFSLNAPQNYELTANNFSLTQSKVFDITIPAKNVSVHVQDSSSNPVSGSMLSDTASCYLANNGSLSIGGGITNATGFDNYSTSGGPITDSSGNVTLWLLPNDDSCTYSLTAAPPSGSNFTTTTLSGVSITSDTSKTITLQQPVTVSGHVYGPLGNALPNQTVYLQSSGGTQTSTTTDGNGSYSLQVSPGTYTLDINAHTNEPSLNAPQNYELRASDYSVTQNTTLDITIPAKKASIKVQDAAGNALNNITLSDTASCYLANNGSLSIGGGITNATGYDAYPVSGGSTTDSSGDVTLWLLPNDGSCTYTLTATPPSGSNFTSTTVSSVSVTTDISKTITLQQPVTLSGHVYGPLGNALPNQTVALSILGGSQVASTTTDSTGNYSIQVSSGTYVFDVSAHTNDVSLNAPQNYELRAVNYSLVQNTTLDVTIPAKKVTVHVQDALSNPVSGIILSDTATGYVANNGSLSIGGGITNATGFNDYTVSGDLTTDSSGNATLWLLPNDDNITYTLTATPPNGSIYNVFALNNISVISDQNELISLQYSHNTPTTIATLSPAPDNQNNYSDPTTVTLSATATSGYTVANTYYTIDGASQQTYSTPFTITGNASHTITYWSVDNSGVTESHNTKTFIVLATYSLSGTVYNDINQNGFQDTSEAGYNGATVTLNSGQTATSDSNGNYSFSNLPAGSYVETLTLPNSYSATTTNPANLSLAANTTQNFGIVPIPTNTPTPTPIQLTSLSPAKVWVGLKNSDDIGIKFDLKAEVYKGNTLVSSGEVDSVSGGSNGFAHAQLNTIPFATFSPVDFPQGTQLSVKVYARNACTGSGKNSGTARLWYNDTQANSFFDATIGSNDTNYYLLTNALLGTIAGTGPKQTSDVSAGAKCSAFKQFGTWSITP
jgi:hypothetical protein